MHVSLAEALEVRGGPLEEDEIWALLNQSAECLHNLFHKGKELFNFKALLDLEYLELHRTNREENDNWLQLIHVSIESPLIPLHLKLYSKASVSPTSLPPSCKLFPLYVLPCCTLKLSLVENFILNSLLNSLLIYFMVIHRPLPPHLQ